MKKRKMSVIILASLMAMLIMLSGCGGASSSSPNSPNSSKSVTEVTFGLIIPLTGGGATTGQNVRDGMLLGIEKINQDLGSKIKINTVIEDSQAKNDLAAQAATKQIQINKVPLIVGAWTGPIMTMAPIANDNKVVLVNAGAQGDDLAGLNPYLFNTIPSWKLNSETLADFLQKDKGLKKVSILYENTASGKDMFKDFVAKWQVNGGQVTGQGVYEFNATDFRSLIAKIKSEQPDTIVICSTLSDENTIILRQLKEAKVTQTIGFVAGIPGTDYIKVFGTLGTPGYQVRVNIEIDPNVAQQYRQKYNKDMETYAAQDYNAAMIIEQALKSLLDKGKEVTGPNIQQAIHDIGIFNIMGGKVKIDKITNTASSDRAIYDIISGKEVIVKTYSGIQ